MSQTVYILEGNNYTVEHTMMIMLNFMEICTVGITVAMRGENESDNGFHTFSLWY